MSPRLLGTQKGDKTTCTTVHPMFRTLTPPLLPPGPAPAPDSSRDTIRCGQCCTLKPKSDFVKNGRVLKSCLRCRQSKGKFHDARPRKTQRRWNDKQQQPDMQVATQASRAFDTVPQYTQAIKSHTTVSDQDPTSLNFHIFNTKQASSKVQLAAVVREQDQRANDKNEAASSDARSGATQLPSTIASAQRPNGRRKRKRTTVEGENEEGPEVGTSSV